ncbi:MAG TPA: MFS transporter [Vitreimonas sp.]|nr:MFS transporter [Vitreimonas sp.]
MPVALPTKNHGLSSSHNLLSNSLFALLYYSGLIFLVSWADGIMAYVTPIYITEHVSHPVLMGFVMAFSSIVGINCDLLFAKRLHGKRYSYFLFQTSFFALLAGLCYVVFSPNVAILLLIVGLWGIYYELLQFSNFHFIHTFLSTSQHTLGWSTVMNAKYMALLVAPLTASYLMEDTEFPAFYFMITLHLIAIVFLFIFTTLTPKQSQPTLPAEKQRHNPKIQEFRIWQVLIKRLWPIYLFVLTLSVLDSVYWTVGALLSEHMADPYKGVLLTLNALPALFVSYFIQKAFVNYSKKRTAFLLALAGSCCLFFVGFVTHPVLLLSLIFISSCFTVSAWPLILATYEDYVARSDEYGNDLIGFENSAISLSYILGPIFASTTASLVGEQQTFSIVALLLGSVSLLALAVTPRKIRLPQSEIIALEKPLHMP